MQLNDIAFPTTHLRDWMIANLNTPGPWQLKLSLKEQVNCLLHFHLSGCSADALHIREYLCNEDSDEVWIRSMQLTVLPYLNNIIYEVEYG